MRFALKRREIPRAPEKLLLELGGRAVPVAIRRNARARRIILRMDPATGLPVLTLPTRARIGHGEAFLRQHTEWIETRLQPGTKTIPFEDGAEFPLRDESCRIVHRGGRGLVRLEVADGVRVLSVPGEAEHLSRRVTDWLKREARRDLEAAVAEVSNHIAPAPVAIRIGDQRSRWGSCSAKGVLSFSWRLVLAPPSVLDYLAAHEVAHLAEMNHGPAFWALVAHLDPDHERARIWLKENGAGLQRIGRAAADSGRQPR